MKVAQENDLFPPERFMVFQDVLHKQTQPFQELTFDH
jgi:hypothetical protein